MKEKLLDIEKRYAAGLYEYLTAAGEDALHGAYEIGRDALNQGVGLLDMILLHSNALRVVLRRSPMPQQDGEKNLQPELFLLESLSPFEMMHRGIRESNIQLHRLNETLENEHTRVAQALHAEAGQLLASVYLALDEAATKVPDARAELHKTKDLLNQIEMELRRLSHELRPTILDDLGLVPALKFLCEGVSARSGVRIDLEEISNRSPAPVVSVALYRIVQEALTNVTRHANAFRVRIELRLDTHGAYCSIKDDGVGFDVPTVLTGPKQFGLGLRGIRERVDSIGGSLAIVSIPGKGTELTITVPTTNSTGGIA